MDRDRNFQFVDCSTEQEVGDEDCLLIGSYTAEENIVDPLDVCGITTPNLDDDEEEFHNFLSSLKVEESDAKYPVQLPVIPVIKKENIKQEVNSDGRGIKNGPSKRDVKNPNIKRLAQNNCIKEPLLRIIKPEQIKSEPIDPYFVKKEPIVPIIKQELTDTAVIIKKEPIVPFIKEEPSESLRIKPEPVCEDSDSNELVPHLEPRYFSPPNADLGCRLPCRKYRTISQIDRTHNEDCEVKDFSSGSDSEFKPNESDLSSDDLGDEADSDLDASLPIPTSSESSSKTNQTVHAAKLRLAEIIKKQIQCHAGKPSQGEANLKDGRRGEPVETEEERNDGDVKPDLNSSKAQHKCYEKVACQYCGEMKAISFMNRHYKSYACKLKRKQLNTIHPPDRCPKSGDESLRTSTITTRLRSNQDSNTSAIKIEQDFSEKLITCLVCGRTLEERLMAYHPCLMKSKLKGKLNMDPIVDQNNAKTETTVSQQDKSQFGALKSKSEPLATLDRPRRTFEKDSGINKSSNLYPLDSVPTSSGYSKTQGKGVVKNLNQSEPNHDSSKKVSSDENKNEGLNTEISCRRQQDTKSDSVKQITPTNPPEAANLTPNTAAPHVDKPRTVTIESGANKSVAATEKKPAPVVIPAIIFNNPHQKETCKYCDAIVRQKEMNYHRKTLYCRTKRKEKRKGKAEKAQSDGGKKDSDAESDDEEDTSTSTEDASQQKKTSVDSNPNAAQDEYNPNEKKPCPDCEDLVTLKLLSHHRKSKTCQAKREYLEYQRKNASGTSEDGKPANRQLEEYNPNRKETCPDCFDLITSKSLTHHRKSWSCQAKKKYFEAQKLKQEQPSNSGYANNKSDGPNSTTDVKPTALLEYNPLRKEPCPDCEELVMVRSMSYHRRSWTCQAKKKYLDSQRDKIKTEHGSDSSSADIKVENASSDSKPKFEEEYNPNGKKPCPDCRDIVTVKLLTHHRKSWTCQAKKKYFESLEEKNKGKDKSSTSKESNEAEGNSPADVPKSIKTEITGHLGRNPCLVCGDLVNPSRMGVHQKSATCLAIGRYKESQRKGIQSHLGSPSQIIDKEKDKRVEVSNPKYLQNCNPNAKRPCPDCGEVLTVRSIPRHRLSFSCIAKRDIKIEINEPDSGESSSLPRNSRVKTEQTPHIKMEEGEDIVDTVNASQETGSQEIEENAPPEEQKSTPDLMGSSATLIQPTDNNKKNGAKSSLANDQEQSDSGDSACSSGFESMEEPPSKRPRRSKPDAEKQQGSGSTEGLMARLDWQVERSKGLLTKCNNSILKFMLEDSSSDSSNARTKKSNISLLRLMLQSSSSDSSNARANNIN